MKYETMKQADYKYIGKIGDGEHVLQDLRTDNFEVWFSNKHHAGYGLKFKNTHLEFARTANDREKFEAII